MAAEPVITLGGHPTLLVLVGQAAAARAAVDQMPTQEQAAPQILAAVVAVDRMGRLQVLQQAVRVAPAS